MSLPTRAIAQDALHDAPAGNAEGAAAASPGAADRNVEVIPNTRSLGFLLQDVARLMRVSFGQAVNDAGLELTTGEARALVHAVAAAGARQTEIAERMGVEPMTLCGYVDRLESRGLVERQPHPADKRAKKIVPTETAGEAIDTIMPLTRKVIADAMEGLPDSDIQAFRRVLQHMHDHLADGRRNG
ncbi:MarR family winged helix-turn-helix transcriptional regulator [Albimonas pacifica]|uniref:Transcriptional regulator, MarR family n=1 Tax=Albimonas pacifica TaxID=1114924 RepID=A0A1I3D7S3_9RHOB|nr:MarR family winged helix-turn-helix transcriptional regulator [Albimonas pacifica]SFH82765.1 transcriptional regulator, MarR family [Albimonas pacifica]